MTGLHPLAYAIRLVLQDWVREQIALRAREAMEAVSRG